MGYEHSNISNMGPNHSLDSNCMGHHIEWNLEKVGAWPIWSRGAVRSACNVPGTPNSCSTGNTKIHEGVSLERWNLHPICDIFNKAFNYKLHAYDLQDIRYPRKGNGNICARSKWRAQKQYCHFLFFVMVAYASHLLNSAAYLTVYLI